MIEISPEILTIIMLGGILVGVLTGYTLAFVIGTLALTVGYAVWALCLNAQG